MRKLILTAVLAGLLVMPVLAQFRGFGGGMMGGPDVLLGVADVQKELKLTDDQKKAIASANTKRMEAVRQAFQDMEGREAFEKIGKEHAKAMEKVREGLTSEQSKRLAQLEVQAAARTNQVRIFQKEKVQSALKLTGKQKEMVKETVSDLEKDAKELFSDAAGDREKMQAAFKKIQGLNKEAFTKVTKSFTEAQKTAWKEIQGDEFKGSLQPQFGFGKGKGKKKKDDF
jgi:hypothetical protein